MPSELTHPGVFVEETPQGPHPIAGDPTSITAFIGAEWEPSSSTLVHGFVNHLIPSQDTLGRTAANAMLYIPRMYVDDPTATGALRLLGASGAVAGVIARTDDPCGVWNAPAGTEAAVGLSL